MGNDAEVPALPDVQPMASFRNQALTWDAAEAILIGWLGKEGRRWSWKVVCGESADRRRGAMLERASTPLDRLWIRLDWNGILMMIIFGMMMMDGN